MTKQNPSGPAGPDALVSLTKALADPGRLRLLRACAQRELCVCEIGAMLGLAFSTVSRHLSVLRAAGLVRTRREGRWVHVARPEAPESAVSALLRWVDEHLDPADPTVAADRCCLDRLSTIPREELRTVLEMETP